ncbi:hypothetical protein [Brevibacillus laterosporus]|uniref:hypothetical protein n=1 Tax=Brevibacillus laterosporus TaxID=1465 RepID=UPI00130D5670|nr:hypothetical protein [Brevibacillus laterosporus]
MSSQRRTPKEVIPTTYSLPAINFTGVNSKLTHAGERFSDINFVFWAIKLPVSSHKVIVAFSEEEKGLLIFASTVCRIKSLLTVNPFAYCLIPPVSLRTASPSQNITIPVLKRLHLPSDDVRYSGL